MRGLISIAFGAENRHTARKHRMRIPLSAYLLILAVALIYQQQQHFSDVSLARRSPVPSAGNSGFYGSKSVAAWHS